MFLTLSQTNPCFHMPTVQVFQKQCGQRGNCLSAMFSTVLENLPPFSSYLKLLSAKSFCLEEYKMSYWKGLI